MKIKFSLVDRADGNGEQWQFRQEVEGGGLTIIYVPDKEGLQPTTPHNFYIGGRQKLVHSSRDGNFRIIAVLLTEEDMSERCARRRARKAEKVPAIAQAG